jgi:Flp pilus assembly protein TadB
MKIALSYKLKILLLFLFFFNGATLSAHLSIPASHEIRAEIALPIKPAVNKKKAKKVFKKNPPKKGNTQRIWGFWALSLGGYCLVFAFLMGIFFFGAPYFGYVLILLALAGIVGLFLVLTGVWNIDQSFTHYSNNTALRIERLRPIMLREFVFAGLLLLISIGFLFLSFYATMAFSLFAFAALLTTTLLKYEEIKRLKNKKAPLPDEGEGL